MTGAHGGGRVQAGLASALGPWPFEPLVWLALAVGAACYLAAARRVPGWPRRRTAAFVAGLGAVFVALATPLAVRAHASFAAHMIQHLLLTTAAAPALLLGAPLTLALRATPTARRALRPLRSPPGRALRATPTARRALRLLRSPPGRAVTHPVVAWGTFAAVMWATHFTALYQASLESDALHAVEHALYLGAGLLFWAPVVGLDPGAPLAHPARLGYLVLALPVQSFLGLALWSAGEVLYPHYGTGPAALADQRAGAVVMWVGGDLLFVAALAAVTLGWMRHDEREARRVDRRLARR